MMQTTFTIQTNGQGLYEFTDQVTSWVQGCGVLTLFIQHTSASILVQENYGIVGDAFDVVPNLIDKLKEFKSVND